ncbi:unnamed protein product [Spirodela intermedia]|uniref:Uncharacterized protein n=1 Tax=Spirodela intermedia TaxID=51605 RepID=A0A7I8LGA2_SPIIN|nr:unnamed protein product [Spirodela intermedia]
MEPHLLFVLNTLLLFILILVVSAAAMASTFALVVCVISLIDLVGKVRRRRRRGLAGLIRSLLSSPGTSTKAAGFVLLMSTPPTAATGSVVPPSPGSVDEVAIDMPSAKSDNELFAPSWSS